jgi:hypothetical protein
MEDTTPMSGSGFPATLNSTIVNGGIFSSSVSSQMIDVIHSTIFSLTISIPSLVVGPTQAMSENALPSIKNSFFVWYVIDGCAKFIGCFSIGIPCIHCWFRGHFGSLPRILLGRRSYSFIVSFNREHGFTIFWGWGASMLTGEIDRPSTERVEPVRGCLITQAVWDEPP